MHFAHTHRNHHYHYVKLQISFAYERKFEAAIFAGVAVTRFWRQNLRIFWKIFFDGDLVILFLQFWGMVVLVLVHNLSV
jgi:hypothetical protein